MFSFFVRLHHNYTHKFFLFISNRCLHEIFGHEYAIPVFSRLCEVLVSVLIASAVSRPRTVVSLKPEETAPEGDAFLQN
jgi:hypothetical protein